MNPKRNRQRAKEHQRKIAKYMEGMDLGTLGKVDVLSKDFSIECKSAKRATIHTWFQQAERYTVRGTKPLVIVHIKGRQYENDYVVIKLKDFMEVLNDHN